MRRDPRAPGACVHTPALRPSALWGSRSACRSQPWPQEHGQHRVHTGWPRAGTDLAALQGPRSLPGLPFHRRTGLTVSFLSACCLSLEHAAPLGPALRATAGLRDRSRFPLQGKAPPPCPAVTRTPPATPRPRSPHGPRRPLPTAPAATAAPSPGAEASRRCAAPWCWQWGGAGGSFWAWTEPSRARPGRAELRRVEPSQTS